MPDQPTHADIIHRLSEHERVTGMIFQMLENIEVKMDDLVERTAKIEQKVMTYDRWGERIRGALIAGTALVAALWWSIHAKIETLLGIKS